MKYLGVDFGLRRIGLASSEGQIASSFKTIEVISFNDSIEKILNVVNKEGFEKIIIGLPEGKIGKSVLKFINIFKKKGLDIIPVDETLSSKKALAQMIELNVSKKKRRFNDEMAAVIILQDYLDSL